MASTNAVAARRSSSGQSRLSHKTALRVASEAVLMLKTTPCPATEAANLASARSQGNTGSRHCDAPSQGARQNDAHWRWRMSGLANLARGARNGGVAYD